MTAIPGILQAFSLTPFGRKHLLEECAEIAQDWRKSPRGLGEHSLERLLLIHDMCKEGMTPEESLPDGFAENILMIRSRIRAHIPTLWERLGVI